MEVVVPEALALRILTEGTALSPASERSAFEVSDSLWEVVSRWASGHRILGLLSDAVRSGAVEISDIAAQDLADALESTSTLRAMTLDAARLASAALEAGDIDHRFFKGVAMASLAYPTGARSFADADVLVPAAHFDRAIRVLDRNGFRAFGPGANRIPVDAHRRSLSLRGPRGGSVDVHRLLARSPFGERIGNAAFDLPSVPLTIGSEVVPGVDAAQAAVIAALEIAVQDRPIKLRAVRDCLELLPDAASDTSELADRWQVGGPVYRGVHIAFESARTPVPDHLFNSRFLLRDIGLMRAYDREAWAVYFLLALWDLPDLPSRRAFTAGYWASVRGVSQRGGWPKALSRQARRTWKLLTDQRGSPTE